MGLFKYWIWKIYVRWRRLDDTYSIKIRDQVCHVMASLTKTFVSPEIVLNQKVNWIVHRNKASARHCSPLRDPWGIRPKLVPVSAGTRPDWQMPLQGHWSNLSKCFTVVSEQLQLALWSPEFVARPPGPPPPRRSAKVDSSAPMAALEATLRCNAFHVLAHSFLHTSVMTVVIAVTFFFRK